MAERMSQFWRGVLLFGKGMEENARDFALSQLMSQLSSFLQGREFCYVQSEEAFVKVDGDLAWKFSIGLSSYVERFDIRPMASVRHEQVERLFHRVSGAPEIVKQRSATVLWQWALEKRIPKPSSFMVERSSQAIRAVEFAEHFFLKWVAPFFGEHSSLINISNSFNDGQRILRAKYVTDWFEMLGRAIIAANLANRDDYEMLKKDYRQALQRRTSMHPVGSFDALVRVLEEG